MYMCSGSVLCMILELLSWENSTIRVCLVRGSFEKFSALNNFKRSAFVLGCGIWERYDFEALRLVKSFVVLIWDTRVL